MHIYGKDQQGFHLSRTRSETWFTRLHTIEVALQLACWITSLVRLSNAADKSMDNSFFSPSNLRLKPTFLVEGCEYHVVRDHAFFSNVSYILSPDNIEYFVSRSVLNIRYLLALTGVYLVVCTVNRIWFETNTHEIRYHFVVFRKDMVTTWEVLLMIMGIVLVLSINRENDILEEYLTICLENPLQDMKEYPSIFPLVELYVSYFVSLGILVINVLVAVWNMAKPNPRDEMLKEQRLRREEYEAHMKAQEEAKRPAGISTSPDVPDVTFGDNRALVGGSAGAAAHVHDWAQQQPYPLAAMEEEEWEHVAAAAPPPPPDEDADGPPLPDQEDDGALYDLQEVEDEDHFIVDDVLLDVDNSNPYSSHAAAEEPTSALLSARSGGGRPGTVRTPTPGSSSLRRPHTTRVRRILPPPSVDNQTEDTVIPGSR